MKSRGGIYVFIFDIEQIAEMAIFQQFNVLQMGTFQQMALLVIVNGFYLALLSFVITIFYKSFLWLKNLLF